MPDGEQWLTVREFAQAAGVSIQAVYQRLDKDLSSYLKTENGRKYVNSGALQFVGITADSTTCQAIDKQLDKQLNAGDQEEINALTAELATVHADLDESRAALDAVRAQLHDAEIRAAAADAERARADAAEQHCTVLYEQMQALQRQLDAMTALLQSEQAHAAEMAQALTAQQALHAGQLRLAMQNEAARPVEDRAADSDREKRGVFSWFRKHKKQTE